MRFLGGVALLCALVGVATGDEAANRRQASEHYHAGTTAYDLGHYDDAVREYEAAYQLFNEPTILYDLGQAHRLAQHTEQALHFYKMYLSKVPDAPNRAEVEAKIAALSKALEEEHKARNVPPDSTLKPPEPVAPPTVTAPPVTTPPATTPPPTTTAPATTTPATMTEASPRGRTLKIAGIVIAAAGVALVAGGIATGVLAKDNADDISRADAAHQPYDPSKYSAYQNDLVATGVLVGVGAAAAITGTALAIVGVREGHKNFALQVAPQLSPTHAGVRATLRF